MAENNTRLPVEILQQIFERTNDYCDVIAASHVSQYWRFSAQSHSLYAIGIVIWISPGEYIAGPLQRGIRRLESAPLPLDFHLTINFTVWDTDHQLLWDKLVVALAGAMSSPGVRRLSLCIHGTHLDTALEMLRGTPAPLLESLTLISESIRSRASLGRLFTGHAPVLREVGLTGVSIDSIADSTAFASAQQMEIMSDSINVGIVLSSCPALRRLTLCGGELTLNMASNPDAAHLSTSHALHKLEFNTVSWGGSDAALRAIFRFVMLPNVPTVRWASDGPMPSVVVQELLHGLPLAGLSLALVMYNDSQIDMEVKVAVPQKNPIAFTSVMDAVGASCARAFNFTPPNNFTPWAWVGTHRIASLSITHIFLSRVLPSIPAFCLPQLLQMSITTPSYSSVVDFWDSQNDLARGRCLTPQLQRLTLLLSYPERRVVKATGLVRLATQVLGLSLFGADMSATARPDLCLVNLALDEQGTELPRLFGRIELVELDAVE